MVKVSDIKSLREITGAGMMDCKKALLENNGDIEKACDWLRKKGIAQAAKKGSRVASEGLIAQKISDNKAVTLELNSETDFVAKNDKFKELSQYILDAIITNDNISEIDQVMNLEIPQTNNKIADEITNVVSIIGENIKLRRFKKIINDNGFISSYIHSSVAENLGKIGVIVSIECDNINDKALNLAKQIAMHIAASKPIAVNKEQVPSDIITKEKEIFTDQSKASGKPENIIEKMVEGRIRKYYDEIVLLEQAFVIDGKTKIKDLIAEFSKQNDCSFKIKEFIRYELGEGIEKKEDNFVEEANLMATS